MINFFYTAKSTKKAIISANNAIASVNAKPKIAILNISSLREGFLEIPITKAPNTVPIPTPAPASPIVANPAPIHLAACNNISHYNYDLCYFEWFKAALLYNLTNPINNL